MAGEKFFSELFFFDVAKGYRRISHLREKAKRAAPYTAMRTETQYWTTEDLVLEGVTLVMLP
jgi:hypothetical protein